MSRSVIATLRERAEKAEAERDRARRAADMYMAERDAIVETKNRLETIALSQQDQLAADRADLARCREALESIAANTCCERCQEAALVARAALAPATGDTGAIYAAQSGAKPAGEHR